MIDRKALLADLRTEVTRLEADLREQVATVDGLAQRMQAEHAAAVKAQRTAATWTSWRDEQVTQAAVAWVLDTVFVRWCEDNELIDPVLSGPGDRLGAAEDAQLAYFRAYPHRTDADWLRSAFEVLAVSDAGAMLFDQRHNPAFLIPISHDGAKLLLAFWRTRRGDGSLAHNFADPSWDTRFLGDLYQDLSDDAKARFALLQTPAFVEEFILDLTLTPAIEEFGLDGLRVIDPTCGSGHFLLGVFHRLVDAWQAQAPSLDPYELARRALDSVHGVDLNPFATAISRFRLLIAAWQVAGVRTVAEAAGHRWRMRVATGDSLLPVERQGSIVEVDEAIGYRPAWEDIDEFDDVRLLDPGSYHVVIGNPPYITVSDPNVNATYRGLYSACHRQFQLTVPFAQRFFGLARRASDDGRGAGHVGQITSNAFMKREFGTKLITEFFPTVALTHVIDTSGAYIPGHGTPTVILIGERRHATLGAPVRAVLGIRGEPSQPAEPAKGLVWTDIADHIGQPEYESEWITVTDIARSHFASHPWSLSGGGADALLRHIEEHRSKTLADAGATVGTGAVTREDAVFMVGAGTLRRNRIRPDQRRPLIEGDVTRDWRLLDLPQSLWPYSLDTLDASGDLAVLRWLWPYRTQLSGRVAFGKSQIEHGRAWFEYSMFFSGRYRIPLSIAFAFVATHNHFVLDRGGKVFNRSAPVIKLPEGSSEEDHLALLGVLNSSTACFWLKQVSHPKGGSGIGRGVQDEGWESRYEFTGTQLEQFPLPLSLPIERSRRLDRLATEHAAVSPSMVCERAVPTSDALAEAHAEWGRLRGRMIAEQEEVDWDVYHRYGLLSDIEAAEVVLEDPAESPELALGERAFEIVLARQVAAGETDTQWFARHGSTPITELPARWPQRYCQVVERRIELIERRRDLALIERPECKRRWKTEPWEKRRERALRGWLLNRMEARNLWFAPDANGDEQPTPRSVHSLADGLRGDTDFTSVAALWASDALDRPDADLAEIAGALVDAEHVPFLAAYRYKGKGFDTRADWERVWELQRAEDRIADRMGHDVTHPEVRRAVERELGTIPVPPKYGSGDFARTEYWRHRGKLDVPKERFISYPAAARDGDGSLLLGWAGWDHREQAQALAVLVTGRRSEDGWSRDRVAPLLAGFAELLPWVAQWHGEFDPAFGGSPAELYEGFLDAQLGELDLSRADLATWRPQGRVDVTPLPRKSTGRGTRSPATPARARRGSAEPDREHVAAVLDAAASGPLSNEQIRALTGLDTAVARAVAQHLVACGELVTTGQKRGTRYQLP